ncbi:MAG: hypothetical protein HZT43_14780 [Exiguobacterium profundum]|nr:MAG: hypothetical protein HZT43_14780 [Exiguobacterium profundum]
MTKIRTLVIRVLDDVAGIQNNAAFTEALLQDKDVSLDLMNVGDLARFDAIMQIEDSLGIEIDDDELLEQATLNSLVAFVERLAAAKPASPSAG